MLEPLIEAGKLYADNRGNAVFLMVAGKANHPVGAELRGTGPRVWRGMAPGTRKDSGYFWVGATGSKRVVLCESAIDAISCSMLYPDRVCISTSGARPNPSWLRLILDRGYEVACGFDADPPGDAASREMIRLYPDIQRLRPSRQGLERSSHVTLLTSRLLHQPSLATPLQRSTTTTHCEPKGQPT